MDDNHHLHHHPYGVAELRQLINGRPQQAPYPPSQHLEIIMMGHQVVPRPDGLCEFHTESARIPGTAAGNGAGFAASSSALEAEAGGCVAGDGASTRWPRQETLTLLEIRSRLDSRFREANHKGPLWDEVSRIMGEEHGYQRSGKKCREKFENLYKYYKKTKEGKAGRQDGKHYRFFRQLEALYGDHISTNAPVSVPESQSLAQSLPYHPSLMDPQQSNGNNNNNNQETTTASLQSHKLSDSLSLSNYSTDFGTSSSDNVDCSGTNLPVENVSAGKKRRGRRSWKAKIKEFIDSKMRKLMEKQEAMVEKMMRALEEKEHERVLREEEWRKQEVARVEKEHKFWAQERAWIEARDAALMDALQNLTSKSAHHHFVGVDHEVGSHNAGNIRGIPVTSADDAKSKEYGSKKRKENQSRCYNYYNQSNGDSLYNQGVGYCEAARIQLNDGLSPSNSNAGNSVHDSGFPFLMNDGDNLWENYGMKLNKGGDD